MAVARELEWLYLNYKVVGSIPIFSSLHLKVFIGKISNPSLPPKAFITYKLFWIKES